jgi:antirestriction protein ArdC
MSKKVRQVATNVLMDLVEARRADIEAGKEVLPWQRGWTGGPQWAPQNLVSGKRYRGCNVFLTSFAPYDSPFWVTKKQIADLGGKLKTTKRIRLYGAFLPLAGVDVEVPAKQFYMPIFFWKFPTAEEKAEGRNYVIQRFSQAWNIEQTEGITHKRITEWEKRGFGEHDHDPVAAAEAIIANMPLRPVISFGHGEAKYRPSTDEVCMPDKSAFPRIEVFYSTEFHELGHATGHRTRLNRDGVTNHAAFGDHKYSFEELVAEMTAAMLTSEAGIECSDTLERSAAYLDNWLRKLRTNPDWLLQAGAKAQKAADFVMNRKYGQYAAEALDERVAA